MARAFWIAVTIVAAVAVYAGSLGGGFVLDDTGLIVESTMVHSLSNLPRAFTTHFLTGWADTESLYYRPLTTISYQLNYALSGPQPFGFRLTNLALHTLASLLVLVLALRLTKSAFAAGLAGLAFAIMPCHAESVAWISGRTDLLAAVFALGSILAFHENCSRPHPTGFSWGLGTACSVLMLCAMLSKESALILPALMMVYLWVFGESSRRGEIVKWLVVLAPAVVLYFVLRVLVMGTATSGIKPDYLLKERLMRMGYVYYTYLRLMLIPQETRFFYGHVSSGMGFSVVHALLFAVPVGAAALAVWFRKRSRTVAFCLGWVLVSLIPAADFIHTNTLLPAERFVYLPSVGAAVLLGWIAERVLCPMGTGNKFGPQGNSRIVRGMAVAVVAAWILTAAFFASSNSLYFTSNLAWARRVTETQPPHTAFRWLAAGFYEEAGEGRAALGEYEAMLDIESHRASDKWQAAIRHRLGTNYAQMDDMAGAARAFAMAVALDDERADSWRDLARANLRLGNYREAVEAFERQLSLASPSVRDRLELGQAYKGAGEKAKARAQFEWVISNSPDSKWAHTAQLELGSM